MKSLVIVLCVAALSLAKVASAMPAAELKSVLERRFLDDRTGACVAAAVIEESISTAYVCADPKTARPFDEHTAFEIGSVTKTMTAALFAQLIVKGDFTLDDPLAKLLPAGTVVPAFGGEPILLKHVVTHTSGLPAVPSRMDPGDMQNPYAKLTKKQLLDSLSEAKVATKPGTAYAYSNFAMMVLTYALAKRAGKDFESLLKERLFAPLEMNGSFIAQPPKGVRLTAGHMSNGLAAPNWDFPVDMAGVGGVRSTLSDMARYAQAQLRPADDELGRAIALTQKEVLKVPGARMGMNWELAPEPAQRFVHGGNTGGYAAYTVVDRKVGRAVVLLSDTAFNDFLVLQPLAAHLIDPKHSPGEPRRVQKAPKTLIAALIGRYRLSLIGLDLVVRPKGDHIAVQAARQGEYEMGYDSAGDFYAFQFDAILRPVRRKDGSYTFTWHQGGGAFEAEKLDAMKGAQR